MAGKLCDHAVGQAHATAEPHRTSLEQFCIVAVRRDCSGAIGKRQHCDAGAQKFTVACRCESGPGETLGSLVAMSPCVIERSGAKRGGCGRVVCNVSEA